MEHVMMTACRHCGERIGTAAAVGGVTTILPAAVVAAVIAGVIARVLGRLPWWLFAVEPVLWLFLTWVFWEGPRWLTMARNRWRTCPRCGHRDWGRPEYSGFGL
jgi:hypothetical protein